MSDDNYIDIQGARTHNLKNIDLKIPRNKLVVITGVSGSGKSSLAFDTLYAEGQRRYVETFSSYARHFLGGLERPDVDKIDGLSPVIAIEQKTTSKSPRSTVGTITEIYDFLRLLFARVADAYSYNTGNKMVSYNEGEILDLITKTYEGKRINILSNVVKSRKGHYRELFQNISKQGFVKVRVDGAIMNITHSMQLDRYKTHDIEIVIDRLQVGKDVQRLSESIKTALLHGNKSFMVLEEGNDSARYYSLNFMCAETGLSYAIPDPNTFSFNSPKGMCEHCSGLGLVHEVSTEKVIPDPNLSIEDGGIAPVGDSKDSWIFKQLGTIAKAYGFDLKTPIKDISKKAMNVILRGGKEEHKVLSKALGVTRVYKLDFEGILAFIESQFESQDSSPSVKRWAEEYMEAKPCPDCEGTRLKKEALYFKINDKSIAELTGMSLLDLQSWFVGLPKHLSQRQLQISEEILKEINARLGFLVDVGLNYLALNRSSRSLSGGESQRIRLATQIGSQLVGVLYILDEPSIGLHQRDNERLIKALLALRDIGNSVIVVEHDKDMILSADHVIDIGPKAGVHGGEVIFQGTPQQLSQTQSLTWQYLVGEKQIETPKIRRKGSGNILRIEGCTGNNLKNVSVDFPLGKMIAVTGVSGSGKSTLVHETLYPILNTHFFRGVKKPMPYSRVLGLEHIDKIIEIDQTPIGRTPRSNPATYTDVFGDIRAIFANTPESSIRGYKSGRFSFNVVGGRCEVCGGAGLRVIEMNFLPDVLVECEACNGKRFNRETLEIRYKGKSISDVLSMTVSQAVQFFENIPKIYKKIKTLEDVGLGYITLGQQSTTLSGGEAQRIKLAAELSKPATNNTLYILDEPTTGLHFDDIKTLINVLNMLVNKGNSMIIIEHNLDIIKSADYIIDMGQEGGKEGGLVVALGTPEEVALCESSHTGRFLKKELYI